jgi:hypothetical protein
MWILKGVLLGTLLFVVSGISYVGIRVAIGLYRLAQAVKAGTASHAAHSGIFGDCYTWRFFGFCS